jgi:glycosyltransferase 2 family protein
VKRKLFSIFQASVTIALLFYLAKKVNLGQSVEVMKQVNIFFLVLSILLFLIFLMVGNWRWKILLDARGQKFSYGYLMKIYFVSWFFNNILPTTVGGDVFRVAYTVKKDELSGKRSTSPALAAAFVDRFIGFIGLFFFASLASGALFLSRMGKNPYLLFNIIGFFLLVIILLAVFSDKVHRVFSWIFARVKILNLGEKFERAYSEIKEYRQVKIKLFYSFLLSLIVQALLGLVWFLVAKGISVSTSVLYYFLYIPVIGVITMLPITVGGLGMRENIFVKIFSTVLNVAREKATAISLLYLIVNLIFALIGGIVFLFFRREAQLSKAGGR